MRNNTAKISRNLQRRNCITSIFPFKNCNQYKNIAHFQYASTITLTLLTSTICNCKIYPQLSSFTAAVVNYRNFQCALKFFNNYKHTIRTTIPFCLLRVKIIFASQNKQIHSFNHQISTYISKKETL